MFFTCFLGSEGRKFEDVSGVLGINEFFLVFLVSFLGYGTSSGGENLRMSQAFSRFFGKNDDFPSVFG